MIGIQKFFFILILLLCSWGCSGKDSNGIDWVRIPGGSFMMGCASNDSSCDDDEKSRHQVRVSPFQMMKSEVTVGMYRKCVAAGRCSQEKLDQSDLRDSANCNWSQSGREAHPINCVDWNQAKAFCEYAGGRLPSEAEWEYGARGTDNRIYPWGNQTASCTYAIMADGGNGCGKNQTWPVCSKTAGNSPFGLCDMAGNVWEWVADPWHGNYNGAPGDGSIWAHDDISHRVYRGGSWTYNPWNLRASNRNGYVPTTRNNNLGVRCSRD